MSKGRLDLVGLAAGLLALFSVTATQAQQPVDAQVPEQARKMIQTEVGKGTIERLQKTTVGGEVFYDVTATVDGKQVMFTVSDSGVLHENLQIEGVPEVVRNTIQTQVAGGRIDQIDKTSEEGEIFYDIDVTAKDGTKLTFTVAADGTLHQQMRINEVAEPVRSAILRRAGGAQIDQIDKTTDAGQFFYDVDITGSGGKQGTFTVNDDGSSHEDIDLADVPEQARNAINEETAGGSIDSIDMTIENGQTFYDVDFIRDGNHGSVSVAADGSLYDLVAPGSATATGKSDKWTWVVWLAAALALGVAGWVRRNRKLPG